MRAPSSFHSTAAGRIRTKASSRSLAVCASIGWTGRQRREREALEPLHAVAHRGDRDVCEVSGEHRRPPHVVGRDARGLRDSRGHDPFERALPELAEEERDEEALLLLGRAAEERRELLSPARLRAGSRDCCDARDRSSTSSSSSVGRRAGGGSSFSAAQPTPTVPCGRTPERYLTAMPTSSGPACPRHSASRAIFASRDEVEATVNDVCAISSRSTAVLSQQRHGSVYETSSSRSEPPEIVSASTTPTPFA